MSECKDKRIGELLYAFELDQLDDEQRRQFEQHLFNCDHCFERAQNFLKITQLLRYDPELKEHIQKLVDKNASPIDITNNEPTSDHKVKYWRFLLVAAVFIFIMILKPWQIEFRPTQEAVAFENLLAIMYFDDHAATNDEARLGEIASDLLINDLSESEFVTVVSSQRLYDILRILGHEGIKAVNKDVTTQVASRARARYMLTGSIVQTKPSLIITSQLVDVNNGNVVGSQRVIGESHEELFSLIDRLSTEIKNDLSLPSKAYSEIDPTACDISSCSIDAYRYFLEGMDYYNKYYFDEAAHAFKKAIGADSTYALAYYWGALAASGDEARRMIDLALKNINKASKKEQMFIKAYASFLENDVRNDAINIYREIIQKYPDEKEAYYRLGLLYAYYTYSDRAIEYFERALAIDPFFKRAYRSLAYRYGSAGDFKKCIETFDKFLSIYPEDATAYENRGFMYIMFNNYEKGIADLKRALQIKPDFINAWERLGVVHLFLNEYKKADSSFDMAKALDSSVNCYTGEFLQIFIPLRQGKITLARQLLDSLINTYEIAEYNGSYLDQSRIDILNGVIYQYLGNIDSAVAEYERAYDIIKRNQGNPFLRSYEVIIKYAENNDFEKAETLVREFKKYIGDSFNHIMYYQYLASMGIIEYFKSNYDKALTYFEEASQRNDNTYMGNFKTHYFMAKNYQAIGDYNKAIREYNTALSRFVSFRLFEMFLEMDSYYNLGICYEQTGDIENAIKNYKIIVDTWKDADRGLKERFGYDEIKNRLSRLETLM